MYVRFVPNRDISSHLTLATYSQTRRCDIKTTVLTIVTAMTCDLPAINSPSNRSLSVFITPSMPAEYQRRFLSNASEAQRPGSNALPLRHVHMPHKTHPRSQQTASRIQSTSYHPRSISYILILSSQLRLSSKWPVSFTFSHQNFVYISLPAHTCKRPTCLIRLAVKYQHM